ncbi:hypothetical protein FB567DRAFT_43149 [Paraphoma chrysanthemicola]|uniref:Uncharacterized protein n=1 Tax=Paraphoma chrysanthemicola TaxID=798071 RepID=A0A8K0W510_9PLEO|nr:hypothetical protein FB567DRAFT_43149 [Paraphoma chrysanthemicola]
MQQSYVISQRAHDHFGRSRYAPSYTRDSRHNQCAQKEVIMTQSTSTSWLLCLPKELRYELYDHLSILEPRSYPFGHTPIASIDRRPPPVALLLSCKALHDEIEDYFFTRATVRFVPSSWPCNDNNPASARALRLARRAELLWAWDRYIKSVKPIPVDQAQSFYIDAGGFARTVDLLRDDAIHLNMLILTVQDLCKPHWKLGWSAKLDSLKTLKELPPRLRIVVGEETFSQADEGANFKKDLKEYVKDLVREGQVSASSDH